jgi:hypothetical protein
LQAGPTINPSCITEFLDAMIQWQPRLHVRPYSAGGTSARDLITLSGQRQRRHSARVSMRSAKSSSPVLSLSVEVEAEPAPVGLRLALRGQGAEVVARVQDPGGELVGCAQRDGGDEVGGGLRVSPSSLCRFTEAGQPGTALLAPGQLLGHRGAHEAGVYADHADLSLGKFAGQRLGQPGAPRCKRLATQS